MDKIEAERIAMYNKKLYQDITMFLIDNGFNPAFKGFRFLRYAIMKYVKSETGGRRLSGEKGLLNQVAKKFNISESNVERDVRYLILNNNGYSEELANLIKNDRLKHVLFTVIEYYKVKNDIYNQNFGILKDEKNIRLLVKAENGVTFSPSSRKAIYGSELYYATGFTYDKPLFDDNNVFLPKASSNKANLKYFTTILTYHNKNDISMSGIVKQIPRPIFNKVEGVELIDLGLIDYQKAYNPITQKEQKFIYTKLYTSPFEEIKL